LPGATDAELLALLLDTALLAARLHGAPLRGIYRPEHRQIKITGSA